MPTGPECLIEKQIDGGAVARPLGGYDKHGIRILDDGLAEVSGRGRPDRRPFRGACAVVRRCGARALRIVAAFEEAQAKGLGVVSLGSKMIDPPVVERARNRVDRARAMGLLEGEE